MTGGNTHDELGYRLEWHLDLCNIAQGRDLTALQPKEERVVSPTGTANVSSKTTIQVNGFNRYNLQV